jgi:hypothetical protein
VLIDHRESGVVGWALLVNASNQLVMQMMDSGPAVFSPMANNTLYHIVLSVTRKTQEFRVWINGVSSRLAHAGAGVDVVTTGQLTIGGRSFTQPAQVVNGVVAHVAVYRDRMFTPADARRHYEALFGLSAAMRFRPEFLSGGGGYDELLRRMVA